VRGVDWAVKEQMLGYLIRWPRIMVTGGAVIALWAGIFVLGNCFGGFVGEKWSGMDLVVNPIYFSVVTFTSLGYGDIQPTSVFMKVAAASEALVGLALMALFILAWARKMVR